MQTKPDDKTKQPTGGEKPKVDRASLDAQREIKEAALKTNQTVKK